MTMPNCSVLLPPYWTQVGVNQPNSDGDFLHDGVVTGMHAAIIRALGIVG